MIEFLLSKPTLIGLHLAFGIIGIDAFIWTIGEMIAKEQSRFRIRLAAFIGVLGFIASWIVGGFYYVKDYGTVVKPIIKAGAAPWAHAIVMEAKEHIFLFVVPLAFTALILAFLSREEIAVLNLRRIAFWLSATIVLIGLSIGLMGYIISAAARWG